MHAAQRAIHGITAVIASMALVSSAQAFQVGGCNNTSEGEYASAGPQPPSPPDTCVQITFGPPGAQVTTPAGCPTGYLSNDDFMFDCSNPLPGYHCNPKAYKIGWTLYSGGACPEAPDFSGLDLDDPVSILIDIPRLVITSLTCTPYKTTTGKNDSAETTKCSTVDQVETETLSGLSGETVVSGLQGTAVYLSGYSLSSQGAQGAVNPFTTDYEAAENVEASAFPGVLGLLAAQQADLVGAQMTATYRVEHWDVNGLPAPSASREISLRGQIVRDGRFDLERVLPATYAGAPSAVSERVTFDGADLRCASGEQENAIQCTLTKEIPAWVTDRYLESLRGAYKWVDDPFDIPLFGGLSYLEAPGQDPLTFTASRYHDLDDGSQFESERYTIAVRGGVPFPTMREEFDVLGNTWLRVEYTNYLEVRTDDWRPRKTVATRFLDPSQGDARVTMELSVSQFSTLTSAQALTVPSPFSWPRGWLVWTF